MILETEGVSVEFGAVRALSDISFTLSAGTVHGIIGPNGAGKSTFIDVLSGRLKPKAGVVNYRGEDITRRSIQWRRRRGMGRSFQRTSVFPAFTVQEQLELVARRNHETDLDGLVASLGLEELMSARCDTISYGDQRRVDIGLALVGSPEVLLLDEPGAGMSRQQSLELADYIKILAKNRGVAVLYVEHDVDAVFRACDVVTVFDLGVIIAAGPPADVRSNRKVIDAYLGRTG